MSALTPRASQIETLPAIARLNARDVMSLLNCSKSTLLRKMRAGTAPLPVETGVWAVGPVRRFLQTGGQE